MCMSRIWDARCKVRVCACNFPPWHGGTSHLESCLSQEPLGFSQQAHTALHLLACPCSWQRHLQDWEAAVQWVAGGGLGVAVDGSRIALWGTSYSGGHVSVRDMRTGCAVEYPAMQWSTLFIY